MNNRENGIPYLLLFFILTVSWGMTGCSASKKIESRSLKSRSSDFLMEQMIRRQVNAEWFEGRAKVGYSDDYLSMGVTATVRMRKDSALWLSIKKLGIEAARVLVTKDSVYVVDRINNQYGIQSFEWLEKQFSIPASLHTLQMIFLGNPVFFNTGNLQNEIVEKTYHLFHRGSKMESNYWLDGRNFQLQQMSFNDQQYRRSFDYQLLDYQTTADKQKFSYFRNLEIDSRETGKAKVEIRFSEIELNVPKSIRFDIPKRYTRIELD